MLKILYLVPNLADTAVARRIDMFRIGGADVDAVGFRRARTAVPTLDVQTYHELGETFDARFTHRLWSTLQAGAAVKNWASRLQRPDVIVARNLEMLALANRLQDMWRDKPVIVYECLDIHRLMLRGDAVGRAMRAAEQRLMAKAVLLITSSPAFVRNYFAVHGGPPVLILENKQLSSGVGRGSNPALKAREEHGPIRIGLFGALRCSRSLTALAQVSSQMNGSAEVILRGKPALTEFEDFHATIASQPHLRFEGAYRNPDDLSAIYSEIHLAWAIDLFEAGGNSQWLLPNRIYEGCFNGAIPVALAGTETAAFIERHGVGIIVPDIAPDTLQFMLGGLTPDRLTQLATAVAALQPELLTVTTDDCRILVQRLGNLAGHDVKTFEAA